VDCIHIDTIKAPDRGEDIPDVKHTGETSNGTKKALVVSRFTIDMSECCYCNLCAYPCPEECIFMVGGPNSSKHPIDYEFSEFDRTDLIYQFAKKLNTEQKENLQNPKPEAEA
jgi:formate hydrogenlyase subunit 6/NADH:ubiquinone oxidoreductase subunit I